MIRLIFLFGLTLSAQTTLYFPASTSAPVNPAAIGTGWEEDDSGGLHYKLADTKGSSAIGAGQTVSITDDTGNQSLDRQYVSTRMAAGAIFSTVTTTLTSVLMMREHAGTDNVDKCILNVRIVSEDGTTDRAVLFSTANYGPVLEFVNNATHRNKRCADGDLALAAYTTVEGDRIVVEIGYQTTGADTSPQASTKYGEDATDCAENETNTTDCAGWIRFSNSIAFIGEAQTAQGAYKSRIR